MFVNGTRNGNNIVAGINNKLERKQGKIVIVINQEGESLIQDMVRNT